MAILTSCRDCGRTYEADRADVMKGPAHWQRCPECREPKDEDAIGDDDAAAA